MAHLGFGLKLINHCAPFAFEEKIEIYKLVAVDVFDKNPDSVNSLQQSHAFPIEINKLSATLS